MSGTYGEPGKNPYPIPGIVGQYSNVVNASTGVSQIYQKSSQFQYTSIGTYNPSTKKFTPDPNASLSTDNIKILSDQSSVNAIKGASITTATKAGLDSTKAQQLITPNTAAAAGGAGAAGGASETPGGRNFDDDIKGSEKTRNKFPQNLIYPLKLAEKKQDVIKFKMVKFQPRKFETTSTNLGGVAPRTTGQIIGVVVLPIPNGISDSNTVNWNSGDMNAFDAFLANTALATIKDGFGAGAQVVQSGLEGASNNAGELGGGLKSAFANLAIGQGGSQILQRTEGAILNPNMELLFNGPSLRPFTFSFKLASRSKEESEMIRKIIRFFKQGSAAQKSQSNLFLRAPHTFQIEYLHQGKPHNFLNQFKECALQSFGVSYTPEGQYATFQDGAMVSYQITMQFQELEPIFNEDYEGGIGDKATDTEIGY